MKKKKKLTVLFKDFRKVLIIDLRCIQIKISVFASFIIKQIRYIFLTIYVNGNKIFYSLLFLLL